MKKFILAAGILCFAANVFAQEVQPAEKTGAEAGPQKEQIQQPALPETEPPLLTAEERQKIFKQRNKEIRKLTKRYRKTKSEEEKVQIKIRLLEIVSQATDESLAWGKERIAATRANMDRWEEAIKEQETNLDAIKAQRVEDILSGEAERRHKLAQKRWKREMKDRKKWMK